MVVVEQEKKIYIKGKVGNAINWKRKRLMEDLDLDILSSLRCEI
jgi:hypothetical protein